VFRRFMIVCWVLFAILATFSGVWWSKHVDESNQYRAMLVQGMGDEANDEITAIVDGRHSLEVSSLSPRCILSVWF